MTNPRIFDIKRYSTHDGPGIRTTVFFMGCPLRCLWCHNPESQPFHHSELFQKERCVGCGACEENPPGECYADARRRVGYEISAEELLAIIVKDRLFYEESGGGVTFSGGEPLAQSEALLSLLKLCSEKGISTAVDTSGYTLTQDYGLLDYIAREADLFLFDLKIIDKDHHRACTGVDNTLIHENLKRILATDTPVELRIPLIPGINTDNKNRSEMTRFIENMPHRMGRKPDKVTYLTYHDTGRHKYEQLGRVYPMDIIEDEKV